MLPQPNHASLLIGDRLAPDEPTNPIEDSVEPVVSIEIEDSERANSSIDETNDLTFDFTPRFTRNFLAPGYSGSFNPLYSVPLGFGYQTPLVVQTENETVFSVAPYPCTLRERQFYCFQLLRDGQAWGPALNTKQFFIPSGYIPAGSYQPPMLFYRNGALLLVYWIHSQGGSLINLISIDTKASSPQWIARAQFRTPNVYNYLGGAMGPSGEIVVAGVVSGVNVPNPALELLRIEGNYARWSNQTIVYFSDWHNPLYTHVVIKESGEIFLFSTLSNAKICPENGLSVTNYKNVALYRGYFGGDFRAVWSDASKDVVEDPAQRGDPCLFRNARFGLDLLYDGRVLSIHRVSDIQTDVKPNNRWAANNQYKHRFVLRDEQSVIQGDLSRLFTPLVSSGNQIHNIRITKDAEGIYYLIANGLDGQAFYVIESRDLVQFSKPRSIATTYGTGYGAQVIKAQKNGSYAPSGLKFWYAGNLYHPAKLNHFLRFTLKF